MICDITQEIQNPEQRVQDINRELAKESLTNENVERYISDYVAKLKSEDGDYSEAIGVLEKIMSNMHATGFVESADCCYSGLALTKVEDPRQKEILFSEHQVLKEAIRDAGLMNYDPCEAPFNPHSKVADAPQVVYDIDNLMVAAAQFFTFTNLDASTGGGMEIRTATMYNKMPVVVCKKGNYVSRMSTGARRIVLLEYDDIKAQKGLITDVFGTLREFHPGIGECSKHGNTLLGYASNGQTVCLPGLIEKKFPMLKYDFDAYRR